MLGRRLFIGHILHSYSSSHVYVYLLLECTYSTYKVCKRALIFRTNKQGPHVKKWWWYRIFHNLSTGLYSYNGCNVYSMCGLTQVLYSYFFVQCSMYMLNGICLGPIYRTFNVTIKQVLDGLFLQPQKFHH